MEPMLAYLVRLGRSLGLDDANSVTPGPMLAPLRLTIDAERGVLGYSAPRRYQRLHSRTVDRYLLRHSGTSFAQR